ncbi:MAG: hypothetical protein JNM21_05905 [Taibaiella sp.]|nr:hypothetical protein [Taibaiella sp.]
MKRIISAFRSLVLLTCLLLSSGTFAKKDLVKIAVEIEAEGKMLYCLEQASWHGTDLFMEKYTYSDNIGGYFSYIDQDTPKCIFISKTSIPEVIGTIIFNKDFDLQQAKVIMSGRALTSTEQDIFELRKAAIHAIETEAFEMHYFNNTNPNIIPVIQGKERKVYILTGPKNPGVVIFGNDYLLNFDEKNVFKSAKQLHQNIIPVEYEEGVVTTISAHNHNPETGDFMTATDICTLMLYGDIAGWKQHYVISKKYFNIWNVENRKLLILPKEMMNKILKDIDK